MAIPPLTFLAVGLAGLCIAKLAVTVYVQQSRLPTYEKDEKRVFKNAEKSRKQKQGNHAQLLAMLKGRMIEVPDMGKEFTGWSKGVNPGYQKMIPLVDAKLESLMSHPVKLSKLKQADFALFAACWWPRSAWDEYLIVTYLTIWLFVWDDEIDMAVGDLSFDFHAAQNFRSDTVRFVTHNLGFGTSDVEPEAPNPIINSFKVIADALCASYTREQRKVFLDEMVLFLEMSELEQQYRLGDYIPNKREYWICRMGTSAVGPCMAVVEYSMMQTLPRSIMSGPEIKVMWDETNIMISIVNDILSLKKELSTGVIISVVPIICASTRDVQLAVDQAQKDLHESVTRLEVAAKNLLEQHQDDLELQAEVRSYIDVCKEYSTGNLAWSFLTGRYGLAGGLRTDGTISITL